MKHYRTDPPIESIKIDHDTIKETSRNFGAQDMVKWLQRSDSALSTLAKVQIGQEAKQYFRAKGLDEGRGR